MKKASMKSGMKKAMKAKRVSNVAKGKRAKSAVFRGAKAKTREVANRMVGAASLRANFRNKILAHRKKLPRRPFPPCTF